MIWHWESSTQSLMKNYTAIQWKNRSEGLTGSNHKVNWLSQAITGATFIYSTQHCKNLVHKNSEHYSIKPNLNSNLTGLKILSFHRMENMLPLVLMEALLISKFIISKIKKILTMEKKSLDSLVRPFCLWIGIKAQQPLRVFLLHMN